MSEPKDDLSPRLPADDGRPYFPGERELRSARKALEPPTDAEKIEFLERRLRRLEAAIGDIGGTLLGEKGKDGFPVLRMWFDALVKEIDREMSRAARKQKEGK